MPSSPLRGNLPLAIILSGVGDRAFYPVGAVFVSVTIATPIFVAVAAITSTSATVCSEAQPQHERRNNTEGAILLAKNKLLMQF